MFKIWNDKPRLVRAGKLWLRAGQTIEGDADLAGLARAAGLVVTEIKPKATAKADEKPEGDAPKHEEKPKATKKKAK